jgi:hypothetical protein
MVKIKFYVSKYLMMYILSHNINVVISFKILINITAYIPGTRLYMLSYQFNCN